MGVRTSHIAIGLLATCSVAFAEVSSFESGVLPILKSNCVSCHGDKVRIKDLNLGAYDLLMKGSESGPVVVPGKPDESLLMQMVSGASPRMPMQAAPLSAAELAALRNWIAAGAVWQCAGDFAHSLDLWFFL